jgi:hypothetical protein
MEGLAPRFRGLVPFLAEFHLMNGMSDYRRIGGYLDPVLAGRFIPAFFLKRFVSITIDATCYSRARIHLELQRRFDLGSFYVFQIGRYS